jgi:hypothetical protein
MSMTKIHGGESSISIPNFWRTKRGLPFLKPETDIALNAILLPPGSTP